MGKSELAWVDRNRFGIIAGGGDKATVEREAEALEARYARGDDERQRLVLRGRIGRLRGGSAVVYAAGSSESEMHYQTEAITRTIAAMRAALCCRGRCLAAGRRSCAAWHRLRERYEGSHDLHERAAWGILRVAAEAPCRMLLENAGHEAPGLVIEDIAAAANGAGYDLRSGGLVDMQRDRRG